MTTNKTIYLIRHGQTDFNLKGIVQGSGIDSDLNDTGKRQAQLFYDSYSHIAFDHIYTSELKRTHQTVAPFTDKGNDWSQLNALNEINWGIFEGLESTPESRIAFQKIVADWRNGSIDKPIEGGESPLDMYNRQQKGWEIISQSPYSNILICMHGRAMRSFLSLLLGTHLSEMDQYPHTNLCLYQLEKNGASTCELIVKNDVNHLASLD